MLLGARNGTVFCAPRRGLDCTCWDHFFERAAAWDLDAAQLILGTRNGPAICTHFWSRKLDATSKFLLETIHLGSFLASRMRDHFWSRESVARRLVSTPQRAPLQNEKCVYISAPKMQTEFGRTAPHELCERSGFPMAFAARNA